ncbi:unnamed protein product, partial [Closterium sp. NIES-53]
MFELAPATHLHRSTAGQAHVHYRCPPGCDGHYHHTWGSACVDLHVHTDGASPGHVHSSATVEFVHTRYRASSGSCIWSGVRVRSGSRLLLVSPPVAPDSSVAPPPGSRLPATTSWHALSSSSLWSTQVSTSPLALTCPALPFLRQGAAARRSSLLFVSPKDSSLHTLHMDVWGPARVSGQGRERYFLLVVEDYTRFTMVFPLRSKGEVVDLLIPWIRTVRLQLRERFRQDLSVLRLHFYIGGEFSSNCQRSTGDPRLILGKGYRHSEGLGFESQCVHFGHPSAVGCQSGWDSDTNLLRDFCCGEGILLSFMLLDSPQQNGIAEHRIGLVMEVAHTSMIHAAGPHFLWPFAVRYDVHQLNLWPRVSLPETSPTLRWTGEVGDASVFQVWGSRAFVRDMSADKLSVRAIPCVFLGFVPDAPGWQFYHPTSRRVLPSQDVAFDELVPFYRLFPYRSAPPPPSPLFLAPDPPPIDPLPPQGPAPSGAASGSAASGGAEPGGARTEGTGSWGAAPGGEEPGGAEFRGAEPPSAASSGGPAGASPRLSPQQL